jgi:hypothetical protein
MLLKERNDVFLPDPLGSAAIERQQTVQKPWIASQVMWARVPALQCLLES